MKSPGWLTHSSSEVPRDNCWLSARERQVLAGLRVPKRRDDWRLGRWTAKAAIAEWLAIPARGIEIVAAADGAPEPYVEGRLAPVAISLSHRAGRALCVVGDPAALGCDLELIEPRSPAFIREWLSEPERAVVRALAGVDRARKANLVWAAKEAGAKTRREGLRLDVSRAVTTIPGGCPSSCSWRPLEIDWRDGTTALAGWWRAERSWVMAVVGDPTTGPPLALKGDRGQNSGCR